MLDQVTRMLPVDQVTRMLPVDEARGALLPPVRLLREAAVVVARTARHWEIVLAGEDPADRARWRILSDTLMGGRGSRTAVGVRRRQGSWGRQSDVDDARVDAEASSSAAMASASSQEHPAEGRTDAGDADVVDLTTPSTGDLPVEGWAELSFADAQARLSGLDEGSLQVLLAYERSHGHRPLFERLLDQRLTSASEDGTSA